MTSRPYGMLGCEHREGVVLGARVCADSVKSCFCVLLGVALTSFGKTTARFDFLFSENVALRLSRVETI